MGQVPDRRAAVADSGPARWMDPEHCHRLCARPTRPPESLVQDLQPLLREELRRDERVSGSYHLSSRLVESTIHLRPRPVSWTRTTGCGINSATEFATL